MATILWKHWRHLYATGSSVNPATVYKIWYSLSHSGDGLPSRSYSFGPEDLSEFFNRVYCFGHLGEEKVYREDAATFPDASQPLVFKEEVEGAWQTEDEPEVSTLSRLDVLKQMFGALINRMLAYNYKTHVGLITVGSTASLMQPVSHVLENFRRAMTDMKASGDTALWDALAQANDQLTQCGLKYPDANKRIICISDGEDTKSSQTSHGSYWLLKQNDVALDSICLGGEYNTELRATSYLLGCYRLQPESLENGLAIAEVHEDGAIFRLQPLIRVQMEPFLSFSERPSITAPPGTPRNMMELLPRFRTATHHAQPTVVNDETFPPRKLHPNLHDDFIELSAAAAARGSSTNSGLPPRSSLRMTRILREMQKVNQAASPVASVFVSESDATFWQAAHLSHLHADEGYPTFAPQSRFITKIKHPNISAHDFLMTYILQSMTTLLDTIYGLLLQPEYNDPVNTAATLNYHHDQVEYSDQVREFLRKYAKKTREEWRSELVGEEDVVDEEEDKVMSEELDEDFSEDHEMSD
ncbi:hypothetical protein B0A55_07452 [Friedmanniomyces simplex]|uniref:VWFA domain-containing protein n=1 Tax=Friedmanniomyces simplex TaxID=329884 RepID=A0A4V5NF18_9PEZI|nr:hypothetical protein B0A55_07452 [Friedmanniomyces simplex]